MRQDVMDIVQSAGRRLWRTRAAEAAAVGAIAGGLCAAALEAAWTVAHLVPWLAAAICLAPVASAAAVVRSARLRRAAGLDARAASLAAALGAASGLGGAVLVLTGAHAAVPKAALPAVLVAAGTVTAAALAMARRVSPSAAALYHDVRLGLGERLSTAVELACSERPDRPAARCVYAQALAALQREQPQRRSVWRRTRATAGALALSAALWAALAFVPTLGVVDVGASFARLGESVGQLSPRRRQSLAGALRRLADQLRRNPELASALRAAALAAEHDPPESVRRRLERTRQLLRGEEYAEAARIARALLAAAGLSEGGGPGGPRDGAAATAAARGGPGTAPTSKATGGDTGAKPLSSRVLVWNPAYAKLPLRGDANVPGGASARPPAGGLVPLADAWTAARDRAAGALAAGAVPPEYRRLVRRFFEVE